MRLVAALTLVGCALALAASAGAAEAAPRHGQRPARPIWRGYGFLPGYRAPARVAWDDARAHGPQWWYGPARFYHGRWNGGGFGPCWTQTPIGNIWNCGK
jgi:hypothetical protein